MEKSPLEIAGRPEKPVACPRCESSNTKFCYYNNHNVNQPRYFCRGCQRYWTNGGSLRNVPVGAGKRKYRNFPPANPVKVNNDKPPNIFCFSGPDLDQGLSPSPVDSSVLSFKQPVACSRPVESPTIVAPLLDERKPEKLQVFIPPPHEACKQSETQQTFVSPPYASCNRGESNEPSDKVGFPDALKQRGCGIALDLKSAKNGDAENRVKPSLHLNGAHKFPHKEVVKSLSQINVTHELPTSNHVPKQDLPQPSQCPAERDESVCCSSVTATLTTSEAPSESNMSTPTLPFVNQSLGLGNLPATWGPSMWPWVWPFMLNGSNPTMPPTMPQVVLPQVGPNLAAAVGMPPVHPAFAAAFGAMAAGCMPQVDPNFTASLAASFLQFPQLWNPFSWGLPWNAAWNMANASVIVPSGTIKRPRSPGPEQDCTLKTVKMDKAAQTASLGGVPSLHSAPAGYFDAFQPKTDGFQLKPTTPTEGGEHSDLQQHQSSHTNPAAQARSAAFQEGS